MSDKQLVKKLSEVMQQVKYIQKTGYNKFHNYKYATEADVNEKVREELAKRNVVMIPNTKSHTVREHTTAKGSREYIVTVEVEFTFFDGDTGESIAFTMFGEGQDAGDKATYKGITGAQKYALMKAFMIPTGDDPEADEGTDERNHGKQSQGRNEEPIPAALKAKYHQGKGSIDGLEEWVAEQKAKGRSYRDMEDVLATALLNKNEHHSDVAEFQTESQRNAEGVKNFITPAQEKMLVAKWKASKHKSLKPADVLELISAEIGKHVSEFKEIEKADINKVIKWLEEQKAA